jgi:hypothetical protein
MNKRIFMNISHTVYPNQTLTEAEWIRQYKVGTRVRKFDTRSLDMMKQWGIRDSHSSKSPFKDIIKRLKVG